MPGQVFRQRRHAVGEDQPLRIDSSSRSLLPQIARRRRMVLRKPQHAVLDPTQYPYPAVESARRDLVAVVEAAECETCGRQSEFLACEYRLRDRAARVMRQIAVGQIDNLLGVVTLLRLRYDRPIADD